MRRSKTQRVVYLGLLTGLAMGLHIFALSPCLFRARGLGLANIISLYVILNFGLRMRWLSQSCGQSWGTPLRYVYDIVFISVCRRACEYTRHGLAAALIPKEFSVVGLSLLGAVTHNLAQITVVLCGGEHLHHSLSSVYAVLCPAYGLLRRAHRQPVEQALPPVLKNIL